MGGRIAGADNVHADRDQIDAMTRHAATHGAELDILPPELDVSGGLPLEKRPSLLAAIEGVERGEYDAVIVAYLSRLGRNVREQLRAWDRVEASGGRIIVVQEGIDTSTPTGRLQRTIMLGIAEHEREQHAERFRLLREWATTAGVWQHRQTPLGYDRDPDTRRLVPNDDAERVRRAFTDRLTGRSVSAIARDLGMTTSGARALLRNRVYLGELTVGKFTNPAAHPAIVDRQTWDSAQTARSIRPPRGRAPGPALLTGLVRCCGCGHIMSRSAVRVPVYACHVNHSAGRCPAPATITKRLLDEHVEAVVLRELERMRADVSSDNASIGEARAAVDAAVQELDAFLVGVQAAGLDPVQFAAAARDRRDAIDDARRTLRLLTQRRSASIDGDVVAHWNELGPAERNHLLGGLVETILVARAGGRGRVVPVAHRVRVVKHGADVVDAALFRGRVRPILSVPFPEADDERVLRVLPPETGL